METKDKLKLYFEKGDKPTQEQFWEWMDSYWHKDEKISQESIDSIEKVIYLMTDNEFIGSFLSVTFPSSVKKIANNAYYYNGFLYQVREVTFNEGLEEIGRAAFGGQSIKKIKTPSTLKIIRNGAFGGQENINNRYDGLDEIILNNGLEIIEDYAFSSSSASNLKNLYIPSSVHFVGQGAFLIASLETVSAPLGLDLSNAGIPATATITYR